MAQEITLPVKLQIENLQNITKEMRSQLGTLKVDSSGYKKLESVIMDIEKRIQQLQVISSRPFVDTKQFTAVSKEIIGIQDDLTKVRIEAGKVKFSDLQLDASQKAKLEEFNSQIKNINDQLKAVKDSAKNTFFETDIGKAWKLNHADDAGKTFTQITKIIEGEVAKQERALHDAEKAQSDYQERLAARKKLSQFINNGHGLTKENLGEDIYNSIFDKNGNFKGGGKPALQTWLEQQFKLDHNVVQSLTDQAGKKVREAFEDTKGEVDRALKQERTRINSSLTEENNRTNKGQTYAQDIVAAQASLDAAKATKEGLSQTNIKLAKTEEDLSNALRKAKLDREAYMQAVTRAAAGQLQMGSSCDKARAQLDSLNHTVDTGKAKLASLDQATSKLQGISNFVNRYVGAYAIIRKVSTAIRNAFNNIKELDKVITSIAVVTNMSQEDLWNKVGQYTAMAQEYGVATKDVYSVSQIFYQQGLQTAQVMDLTTETLKMAKIAGIDYSQAANAMTVAVRAFKIEMEDAQRVTDAYSALAAKFAVSSAEIANAMEKTASSAASVGMSLESTSAFISVMEQTTRESAQNIGSALKSIISRYGEMKASPDKLINVDGEEVAFNKVDTALASIGISIKDAAGQFRNFDDVIMELAAKWDTLDNNTQRYIATVMAGNRQQSRFIALVSNYDELSRAMEVANNAENASIVQVAKTMDSLESKTNQLKNAFSQLYLDLHIENGLKDIYDWITRILRTVGKLGTLNGVLPTLANIIGFGTGTKSLLKSGMDFVQSQKGKYQLETQEAEEKVKAVRAEAERDIVAKYKIQADLSELEAQLTQAKIQQESAAHRAYAAYQRAGGTDTQEKFIANVESGKSASSLVGDTTTDETQLEAVQSTIHAYRESADAVKGLTSSIQTLKGIKDEEAQKSLDVANAKQQEEEAGKLNAQTTEELNGVNQQKKQTDQESIETELQELQARRDNLQAIHQEVPERLQEAIASREAILGKQQDTQETHEEVRARKQQIQATKEEAEVRRSNKNKGEGSSEKSGGWADHQTAMKVTGLISSVTRLAGTAITALGAGHQDKSTDIGLLSGERVEKSKIYTGIGNGLSMAGTGASMGMAFGPFGSIVGAIGGFLLGGLGAIIDGATMTLEEQLALERDEAKRASDEALKAQAKTLDLKSSIDNIQKLKEAMYNSTEDMNKYKDAMNTMASQYPSLISNYDEAGNAVIDLNAAELLLAQTRLQASEAANAAAKAEAQTRQTSIKILTDAIGDISDLKATAAETNGYLSNSYTIRRFTDEKGQIHDIQLDNSQWGVINSIAASENKNLNEISFNDFIKLMNNASGPIPQGISEDLFSNVVFNDDGSITGAIEYDYVRNVKDINEALKSVKDELGLAPESNLPSGAEYVYALMGWKENVELTAERMKEVQNTLIERTDNYKGIVEQLDKNLPIVDAQESLDRTLLNASNTASAAKVSTSKIAAKLIANQLESLAEDRYDMTAGAWSRSEDKSLSEAYINAKTSATETVVNWFMGLSDDALDQTLAAFGSMTEYLSIDQMLQALGYKDQQTFITQSGLKQEDAQALLDSWQQSFIDANQSNRNRILQTIYGQNGKGRYLNTDLKGLAKFTTKDATGDFTNLATDIAELFKEGGPIISKYADYFTTQLLDINKLAENGYTNLAKTRLSILSELANTLSQIDDNEVQKELFATITSIDLSSYDSIEKAIDSIKSYEKLNGTTKQTTQILAELEQAKNDLIFNVNTLAQELTEQVSSAAKNASTILTTSASGLDFSKAIEELESLNVSRTGEDKLSFDEAFQYDAVLNKYIYTNAGLIAAIEANEGKISDKVQQLTETAEIYTKKITSFDKDSGQYHVNATFSELAQEDFTSTETLYKALENMNIFDGADNKVKDAWESLLSSYLSETEAVDYSTDGLIKYIEDQAKKADESAEYAKIIEEQLKTDEKNQLYKAIDWSAIALGTDYTKSNEQMMQNLATRLGLDINSTYEAIINKYLDEIYKDNPDGKAAALEVAYLPIINARIQQYQDAISELLDPSAYISVATQQIAEKLSIGLDDIRDSTENAISAAEAFLEELASQIGQGGYTIESYNTDAKSILDKTLGRQTQSKAAMDFISSDITGDSLETLANALNLRLTDIIDVATGKVKSEIGKHLKFNVLTGEYDITSSFDEFINAMNEQFNIYIMKGTKQYTEALKAFNDAQINEYERINKNVSEEINKVINAKDGERINLAQLYTSLSEKGQAALKETFEKNGADFANGILILSEGANISAIAEALAQKAAEEGLILESEFNNLVDAINDLLSTITGHITNGINGKLSSAGARNLQDWASNNGLGKIDFTRTKDGLKLTQKSAEALYNKLKEIDSISAQIVFDELSKSIEESVTSAKELEGIMREVAEIRATTESDDFKFMDHDIPSGQNNPINYLENWSKAFKAMDEAGKAGGKMKNMMDYTDFYNIITEMGNLAQQTGAIKLSGDTVLTNCQDAAALIERGAAALSVAADGSIKVDLSKLGIDFSTGASDLKANVGKGIQEIAKSQIEMLDSMIQLLETIVAMEELGDIDVEGNGIDFNEMFKTMYDDKGFELNTYEWTEGMQRASKNILDYAESLGKDSDLYKGLDSVIVNGTSMRQLLEKARDNIKVNKEDAQAYHAAVKAFYTAMQSGNYDLDSIMESMKEVLAGTGFEGDIQVGDMTLTFHYGQIITKTENGKYVGADNIEYNSADEAAWSQMLAQAGIKTGPNGSYDIDSTDNKGKVTGLSGTLYVGDSKKPIKVVASEDHLSYMGADGTPYNTLDRALQSFFIADNSEEYSQWTDQTQEGFSQAFRQWKIEQKYTVVPTLDKIEDIKLDNFQKDNLANKTADDLNKEWASMKPIEFKAKYGIDLGENGITEDELNKIKEINGLESKTIEQKVNVSVDEGQDIYDFITEDSHTVDLTVNVHAEGDKELLDKALNTDSKVNGGVLKDVFSEADQRLKQTQDLVKSMKKIDEFYDNFEAMTQEGDTVTLHYANSQEKLTSTGEKFKPFATQEAEKSTNTQGEEDVDIKELIGEPVEEVQEQINELNETVVKPEVNTEEDIDIRELIGEPIEETQNQINEFNNTAIEPKVIEPEIDSSNPEYTRMAAEEIADNFRNQVLDSISKTGSFDLASITAEQAQSLAAAYAQMYPDPSAVGLDLSNIQSQSEAFRDTLLQELNIWNSEITADQLLNVKVELDTTDAEQQLDQMTNSLGGNSGGGGKKIETEATVNNTEADKAFKQLTDSRKEYQKPIKSMATLDNKSAIKGFKEIIEQEDLIEGKNPLEVEIGEEIQTNDETKEHLHQIYQRLVDIESKLDQQIRVSAPDAPGVASALGEVATAAESIPTNVDISVNISTSGSFPKIPAGFTVGSGIRMSTGNVGLANAKGTLMGELGPELVVSNGRYFVAGQNGTEFVDLADDAIVFNHLQTEQLLKHGMSKQRGQVVTNERNAVSFATGNVNGGPALASAKSALAALRQLRAQWQSIYGMTAKDLAGLGGSGGSGGGGNNKQADPKAFVKQLEIWYNWLQRIAVLEEKINYEEAKRNEISSSFFPNGKEYVQSQKESLDYLKEQAAVQMSLVKSQQEYFAQRRAEMNSANNPFSALYTFDEYGQLKYKDGGLEQLSQLVGRNSLTGQANMSAEEQYSRLVSMGYGKYMDYDSSGNPIDKEQDDWYVSAVQAFWDKVDSDREEMQSLHDSIEEHKKALLEEEEKINGILKEIEDNQINLEQKVLKGIEESRQREIDELQKQRDAIEESSQKLIDGLSEQLQKERDMYSNDESGKELTSLQRQLAILQRSGGSASQIASLQKEISQKQQDAYFEAQQAQIDALQEATDKQLEKLDAQINLMTEALEYEKLHGMLWEQVYEVLNGTPAEIAQFIKENTSDYWSQSAAQVAVNMREDLFEAEKFKAGIEYLGGINQAAEFYSKKAIEEEAKKKREEEEKAKAKAAAAAQGSQSSSGGNSSSGSTGNNNNNDNKDTNPQGTHTHNKNGQKYVGSERHYVCSICGKDMGPVEGTIAGQKTTSASIASSSGKNTANIKGISEQKISTASGQNSSVILSGIQKVGSAANTLATVTKGIFKGITGSKRASGGYVDHGIYELGERGTETVLTAEQTQVLRNNILSNRPNSLISLLKSYNEGYSGINNNIQETPQVTDNSTIIQQATVEMHVSKISNDYDAQRAGEKALEKMLSIARKTQAQNRVGR